MFTITASQRALLTPVERLKNAIWVYFKDTIYFEKTTAETSIYISDNLRQEIVNSVDRVLSETNPVINKNYSLNAFAYILAYYVKNGTDNDENFKEVTKFVENLSGSGKKKGKGEKKGRSGKFEIIRMTDIVRYIRMFEKLGDDIEETREIMDTDDSDIDTEDTGEWDEDEDGWGGSGDEDDDF